MSPAASSVGKVQLLQAAVGFSHFNVSGQLPADCFFNDEVRPS